MTLASDDVLLGLHRRALAGSALVADAVPDDQWGAQTPCAGWSVRDLLEHMTMDNRGFTTAVSGERADSSVWSDRALGPDLRRAYGRSATEVVVAFAAEDALDTEVWLPRIDDSVLFPARQALTFHLLDYVVHTWDLATALGRPADLPDEVVEQVLEIAHREVPDGPRRRRPEASFQPPTAVEADAPDLDRLVAFLGRAPRWPH